MDKNIEGNEISQLASEEEKIRVYADKINTKTRNKRK